MGEKRSVSIRCKIASGDEFCMCRVIFLSRLYDYRIIFFIFIIRSLPDRQAKGAEPVGGQTELAGAPPHGITEFFYVIPLAVLQRRNG